MLGKLKAGKLARMGLLSTDDLAKAADLVAQVQSGDVETVRVLFVDQHGILRGKTIVASAFGSVFDAGIAVPSTLLLKDTSHRTAYDVWSGEDSKQTGPMQGANDVLLVPHADTFRVLPWSPHSAWIFCDVMYRDGQPIPFSSRQVLRKAVDELTAQGMAAVIGLEVEFHIFERIDGATGHDQSGMPGAPVETRNLAQGYQFLTENSYGQLEPVLDDLRRHAQALGLPVRSVEVEMGPSQVEFTFDPADPMTQADALVMFRSMVKQVCAARGLHASFMAKPRLANTCANGWHIHQSLIDLESGKNLFVPDERGGLTSQANGWIAGLLKHAAEASVMIAPSVNSYKRYLPYQLAPNRIQWGEDNRGAMLRSLVQAGDKASRVENRAPDTSANPYFALAAQLISGTSGIEQGLVAPPPTLSPYEGDGDQLPRSLGDALQAFQNSTLFRDALGDEFCDYLLHLKRFEWNRYLNTVSEWEQAEYFNLY